MQKQTKNLLAPLFLALAILTAGCNSAGLANSTASTSPDNSNQPASPLTGGALPQATLPPITGGLPTLVPTISLPTATPSLPPTLPPLGAQTDSATPQAAGQPVSAACLVGAWEVAELEQVMAESLEQSGASLTLESVQGRALYEFSPDGGVVILYDGLSAALTGLVEGAPVQVTQSLNGSGTARYTVDAASGEMLLSDFGGEGIQSRLMVNDQVLAEGSVPVWQALAGQLSGGDEQAAGEALNQTRAAVACSADALVIQALEPVPSPPVRLVRVR